MIYNTFIGIDPGNQSGSITIIYWNGDPELIPAIHFIRFDNSTLKDIDSFLYRYSENRPFAFIEKARPMPKQGVSSTCNYCKNYGFIIGLFVAKQIPYEEIVPTEWQKFYKMSKDLNETKTHWKNRLRQKAEQLYPKLNLVNQEVDSLLIANYCFNKKSNHGK